MANFSVRPTVETRGSRCKLRTASRSGPWRLSATISGWVAAMELFSVPPMRAPPGHAPTSISRGTPSPKPLRAFNQATRSTSPSPRLPERNGPAKTVAKAGRRNRDGLKRNLETGTSKLETGNGNSKLQKGMHARSTDLFLQVRGFSPSTGIWPRSHQSRLTPRCSSITGFVC